MTPSSIAPLVAFCYLGLNWMVQLVWSQPMISMSSVRIGPFALTASLPESSHWASVLSFHFHCVKPWPTRSTPSTET